MIEQTHANFGHASKFRAKKKTSVHKSSICDQHLHDTYATQIRREETYGRNFKHIHAHAPWHVCKQTTCRQM